VSNKIPKQNHIKAQSEARIGISAVNKNKNEVDSEDVTPNNNKSGLSNKIGKGVVSKIGG